MNSPRVESLINQARYAWLPPARKGICRVRHDRECWEKRGSQLYSWLGRIYTNKNQKLRGLPESVRIKGGFGAVDLSIQWQDFFRYNNSLRAQMYVYGKPGDETPDTGWLNKKIWPHVEQLCWGGDYVVVTDIVGDRAYIEHYYNDQQPPELMNGEYNPNYLQLFSVTYTDDTIGGPPCGPCLTFPIANRGENLYMKTSDLTFLRVL